MTCVMRDGRSHPWDRYVKIKEILGNALVSEPTADQLSDAYEFGPTRVVDLKGKGPTPARVLLGRRAEVPITVPSA